MKFTVIRLLPFVVVLLQSYAAQAETIGPLICSFQQGISGGYQSPKFDSKKAAPLSFEVHNIDLGQQTATLFKKSGAQGRPVRVVRAINANHFLEPVNEGFLNLTTIYDRDPAIDAYPAVHSRHLGVLGQPLYAQYVGTCKTIKK